MVRDVVCVTQALVVMSRRFSRVLHHSKISPGQSAGGTADFAFNKSPFRLANFLRTVSAKFRDGFRGLIRFRINRTNPVSGMMLILLHCSGSRVLRIRIRFRLGKHGGNPVPTLYEPMYQILKFPIPFLCSWVIHLGFHGRRRPLRELEEGPENSWL
jgi:hypothetical protein